MRLVERYRRVDHDTVEFSMVLTDPQAYTEPWVSDTMTLTLADNKTAMREDVCVPSLEKYKVEKYREVIREPAGRGVPGK
jgi:hypothetical protein